MKYFFLAAFFLIAKKCHHAKEPVLFESTRQNWSGGAAGSGHGINFCFYVKNSTATNYSFDSLWVDEKRLQITKSQVSSCFFRTPKSDRYKKSPRDNLIKVTRRLCDDVVARLQRFSSSTTR